MKLLIDSGSTKADWISIDNSGQVVFTTQTLGLNPEVLVKEEIIERLNAELHIKNNQCNATHLYFYGAGCGTNRMKIFLTSIFQDYFPNAEIVVREDTYAAVFATTQDNSKAIVAILGTGSNCSYFDGTTVHQKVQSLGYIAMDDCSGNQFGRLLIRDYYFNVMPKHLASKFETEFDLDADVLKENFYKKPNPNAYLATFAKFLIDNKSDDYCQEMIGSCLEDFVKYYIKQYRNYQEVPVHFIGSIAYYLKDEIKLVLDKHSITLGNVLRRPVDGLISYHT